MDSPMVKMMLSNPTILKSILQSDPRMSRMLEVGVLGLVPVDPCTSCTMKSGSHLYLRMRMYSPPPETPRNAGDV
jgi:hypothetical protein